MKRVFIALHRRLKMLDIADHEAAEWIGKSQATFSRKMSGQIPWTEPEMQKILSEVGQPEETLADLFPRRQI
jgi:hypothetical protein